MKKMMLTWLTVASLLMGCSGSETSVKGTYRNPVIYADVPDMSVTRAGEYYYMISTTMHLMPIVRVHKQFHQSSHTLSYQSAYRRHSSLFPNSPSLLIS